MTGDFDRIDWNLVRALDALLRERSVSGAANRLGISQPGASSALARLRRHFGDELLVRRGNTYSLTPLAERLAPRVEEAVKAMRTTLASSGSFDPATSTREFTVAATEYGQSVVGPALTAEVWRLAPQVRLTFRAPFDRYVGAEDVLDRTDGWLVPKEAAPGYPSTRAVVDQWRCVVAKDHPTVTGDLTLRDAGELPWVTPTVAGKQLVLQLDGLRAHGIEPNIHVTTESFASVPFLVAGTIRIGLVQGHLATRLAPAAGVRVLPCPWVVPPIMLTLAWHRKWEGDPAHAWFRAVVDSCLGAIGVDDAGSRR